MDDQYVELARRIGIGQSERIPKLFQMLADADEARLLLALPGDVPSLAARLGRPEQEISAMMDNLFVKGLVFPSTKTTPPSYRLCRHVVQFHDATILWPEAPREFLDLWQDFMETEWPDVAKVFNQMTSRPYTRVIPVGVTVPATTHVLAFEDIRTIVENARTLAVTNCTCRMTARKCDKQLEACIQVNRAADYALTRGTGRQLTGEEALELVRRCEQVGLIHVVINNQDVDNFICNCCPCCCQTMPILIKHGIRVVEPSRFAATVDATLCEGCGTCEERCYFDAIRVQEDEAAQVSVDKCLGCGLCQVTCPSEAISMVEVRGRDFVPEKLFG